MPLQPPVEATELATELATTELTNEELLDELATELLLEETVTTEDATLEVVVEHTPRPDQALVHAQPAPGA